MTTWTGSDIRAECRFFSTGFLFDTVRFVGCRRPEGLPDLFQFCRPATVGEKAKVADAHEALGQDVLQEAPDEFFAA